VGKGKGDRGLSKVAVGISEKRIQSGLTERISE